MASQNTVEPLCITTTKIHQNFALWPSWYSDELVAVLTVTKVNP